MTSEIQSHRHNLACQRHLTLPYSPTIFEGACPNQVQEELLFTSVLREPICRQRAFKHVIGALHPPRKRHKVFTRLNHDLPSSVVSILRQGRVPSVLPTTGATPATAQIPHLRQPPSAPNESSREGTPPRTGPPSAGRPSSQPSPILSVMSPSRPGIVVVASLCLRCPGGGGAGEEGGLRPKQGRPRPTHRLPLDRPKSVSHFGQGCVCLQTQALQPPRRDLSDEDENRRLAPPSRNVAMQPISWRGWRPHIRASAPCAARL